MLFSIDFDLTSRCESLGLNVLVLFSDQHMDLTLDDPSVLMEPVLAVAPLSAQTVDG
jgi:hypothetical protein